MLLVDDDVVYRMLSEKLLQVFGCMIDIAVDGAAAVSKMNLEKYDLVFMVCSLSRFFLCVISFFSFAIYPFPFNSSTLFLPFSTSTYFPV